MYWACSVSRGLQTGGGVVWFSHYNGLSSSKGHHLVNFLVSLSTWSGEDSLFPVQGPVSSFISLFHWVLLSFCIIELRSCAYYPSAKPCFVKYFFCFGFNLSAPSGWAGSRLPRITPCASQGKGLQAISFPRVDATLTFPHVLMKHTT